tara:strand:- start:9333 stop:9773 length:441 start_codon:yes stop_codon:yes gene_type:complete
MKTKFIDAYMDTAKRFAELSHCERLKVGAIVVKDDRIISIGYNGMPTGWDNCCEDVVRQDEMGYSVYKTRDEVLHAEANALTKLAKSTESGDGASLFCTHSPCIDCAKLIVQSGITDVYYEQDYRSKDGLIFLTKSGLLIHNVKTH